MLESVIDGLSGVPVIWKRRERRVKLDVKHSLLPQVCVDVRLASVFLVLFDESYNRMPTFFTCRVTIVAIQFVCCLDVVT